MSELNVMYTLSKKQKASGTKKVHLLCLTHITTDSYKKDCTKWYQTPPPKKKNDYNGR